MKKTIITILVFIMSITIMSAQDIEVSSQDIVEIKESLNELLKLQMSGSEQNITNAKKDIYKGFTWGLRVNIPTSSVDSDFIPFDIRVDLGYYVTKRLFLSLIVDGSIGLFSENNTKTYGINEAIGGGIGYDILQTKFGDLDIRASAGTTIWGKRDYKFTYYDAGVHWNQGFRSDLTKITFGVGVRYYDSKTSLHNDNWKGYISLGFKFN